MKAKILGLVAVSIISTQTLADENGPGCGLGSQVFDGQSGLAPNVLAATTNGTSGNQTFGMSSGTSGCDSNNTINYQASIFLDDNMDSVAEDFSRGQGESLDAFASLLGIQDSDKSAFATTVKSNFSDIFTSQNVKSTEVLDNLVVVMKQDKQLASYVS